MKRVDERIARWRSRGRFLEVAGTSVFAWEQGEGPPLVAIHGFPCSSYDWRLVAELLPHRRFIALDLPGFGLSRKDPSFDHSLVNQARVIEAVMTSLGVGACDLLAHDMGDSVAAELLARHAEGSLAFGVDAVMLLNGSVFIELAHLTRGQRLFLRMPPRRVPIPYPVRLFRRQIGGLFARGPEPGELEMLEALLRHGDGHRIVPIVIRYLEERRERATRWTAGLVEHPGELAIVWGEADPVAVPAIADRLQALRSHTVALRLDDVGHWPQLEVPEVVARALDAQLSRKESHS